MSKPSLDDIYSTSIKEHGFTFPLPTTVEGIDAGGASFQEETTLSYISHQRSTFALKSGVTLGTRLKLLIDLPQKLAEDKNLKLALKGKVVSIEMGSRQTAKKTITIKFDSKYIIAPDGASTRGDKE
ncbi:MAG: PilZ domain-containing protein [Candidatus Aminicenantes bacterium]|jgi:hypothetical protein|nr:PilZ domain-containing protein [Candidatus Aminicenantes bacterium]